VTGAAGSRAPAEFLAHERPAVEAALARLTASVAGSDPLREAVRYALSGAAKRLRPILCVTAYRAVGGNRPDAAIHDLAVALELVHAYSLVHDDLPCMDDDALRRGRPTVHRVFGVDVATVVGTALIPLAMGRVLDAAGQLGLNPACASRLVTELARGAGAGGMVGGQFLDLQAEGRAPHPGVLGAIHARKTGALLAAAPRMGGIAGGAGAETVAALGRYGQALGLAFQIADDVLDVTGDPAILGKESGRDTAHEKATYPALLGLEEARNRAADAAAEAVLALRGAGLRSDELEGLARFAAERDR
jgi:farnesyl diphosphate synthase/geranylgeranyl diphosphate synthase type II